MHQDSWVVLAGGAGFIGCHLTRAFLNSGRGVICVDDVSSGRWSNLDGLDPERVVRVEHDVRQGCIGAVRDVLPSSAVVSAVCNFASPASPPAYLARPVETLEIGSIGTKNLIDLAVVHGARFLQASTSEVYGDPAEHPQRETYWGNVNPIGPRACYDEAKRFGEALCTSHERTCGLDLRLVRIFNTYGPRMQANDGRVVTNFVGQALAGVPLTVFGDGIQTRSLCFVDDLVRGLILLLDSEVRGPLNLGSPVEVSMLELAQMVIALTNSTSSITFSDLPVDDPLQRQPDISRATSLLGGPLRSSYKKASREPSIGSRSLPLNVELSCLRRNAAPVPANLRLQTSRLHSALAILVSLRHVKCVNELDASACATKSLADGLKVEGCPRRINRVRAYAI